MYIPGLNWDSYLDLMVTRFPSFANCIWSSRPDISQVLERLSSSTNEFERDDDIGRGDSYRHAQLDHRVRLMGIERILQLATANTRLWQLKFDGRILDVLGGDGVLQLASRELVDREDGLNILTADIAGQMVLAALARGIPAVRQAAQQMLVRDASFNAVVIAYGSHHIPVHERRLVLDEAYRVLKPGGRVVLHDFETGSPVAEWFARVVDRYAAGGHNYVHFTRRGMLAALRSAGFTAIRVEPIYDPLRVIAGSPAEARKRMVAYVTEMYGLTVTESDYAEHERLVWSMLVRYFNYDNMSEGELRAWDAKNRPTISAESGVFFAEVPRVALVASGIRPEVGTVKPCQNAALCSAPL